MVVLLEPNQKDFNINDIENHNFEVSDGSTQSWSGKFGTVWRKKWKGHYVALKIM
jgi:hypothetical protein